MPSLFDPIKLGAIDAPNRVLMAPLTRGRATREHVPTELMQTYYAQRAAAGLIITRGDRDQPPGPGLALCAGHLDRRSRSRAGSRSPRRCTRPAGGSSPSSGIWAGVVHPSFLGGAAPVSASATTAPYKAHTYEGRQPYDEARRARASTRFRDLIGDYERAAGQCDARPASTASRSMPPTAI